MFKNFYRGYYFLHFLLVFYVSNRISYKSVKSNRSKLVRRPLILIWNWRKECLLLRIMILIKMSVSFWNGQGSENWLKTPMGELHQISTAKCPNFNRTRILKIDFLAKIMLHTVKLTLYVGEKTIPSPLFHSPSHWKL